MLIRNKRGNREYQRKREILRGKSIFPLKDSSIHERKGVDSPDDSRDASRGKPWVFPDGEHSDAGGGKHQSKKNVVCMSTKENESENR